MKEVDVDLHISISIPLLLLRIAREAPNAGDSRFVENGI